MKSRSASRITERTCLTSDRRERRRERMTRTSLRIDRKDEASARTPGIIADIEAVKKFSRMSKSMAFIWRSISRFMYCVWMSNRDSSGPCSILYVGDCICCAKSALMADMAPSSSSSLR
jgi:hypothetical protein